MALSRRIAAHIRSHVVAYLALFMAFGGTAYANLHVYSTDIVDGQVKSVDIGDGEVKSVDVANAGLSGVDIQDHTILGLFDIANSTVTSNNVMNNNLKGEDVKDGSLTGADVGNGSLAGADVKDDGLTGADVQENTLSVAKMGCQSGKVLGFARIHGAAPIGQVWTSSPEAIDLVNNCAGGKVEVKEVDYGIYYVRFTGLKAALAVATPNTDGMPPDSTNVDNIISVGKASSGPNESVFRVEVQDVDPDDSDGAFPQPGQFTILVP